MVTFFTIATESVNHRICSLHKTFKCISKICLSQYIDINSIQNGLFRGCSRMVGGKGGKKARRGAGHKICCIYPTMMKFGSYTLAKEGQKNILITWHTPWALLTSAFFHRKSANITISKKYRYRLQFDT